MCSVCAYIHVSISFHMWVWNVKLYTHTQRSIDEDIIIPPYFYHPLSAYLTHKGPQAWKPQCFVSLYFKERSKVKRQSLQIQHGVKDCLHPRFVIRRIKRRELQVGIEQH